MKRTLMIAIIFTGSIFLFSMQSFQKEIFEQPIEERATTPPSLNQHAPPPPTLSSLGAMPLPPPPPHQSSADIPPPPQKSTPQPLPPPPPPRKTLPQQDLYQKGLKSTVNFICPNIDGTYTVATGAIIDPHGYIIANAHITQKNNLDVSCTIRRGSPAAPVGKAKLVFLPSDYHSMTDEDAQARLDFSIWKLEGQNIDWPYWDIDFDTSAVPNEELLVQSYPAELLSSEIILKNLGLVFSSTLVSNMDTSVIASRATITAQHGSSGGILIDPYTAKLRGMIFGISADGKQQINERVLYALTPSRINGIVWQETQKQLREYLAALPQPTY